MSISPGLPTLVLSDADRSKIVCRGDIIRGRDRLGNLSKWIPCYLGNGHLGASFDPLGTMAFESSDEDSNILGETHFCNLFHYMHGDFGMDYALPLGRLRISHGSFGWTVPAASDVVHFEQALSIYEGILRTAIESADGLHCQREQFFSQVAKNLFVFKAHCESPVPIETRIAFQPILERRLENEVEFHGEAQMEALADGFVWTIDTGSAKTWIALRVQLPEGGSRPLIDPGGWLTFSGSGEYIIWISIVSTRENEDPSGYALSVLEEALSLGFDAVRQQHLDWFRDYWKESLICFLGIAEDLLKIWLRSNYYLACTLSDQATPHPPLITGLASVNYLAFIPQDFLPVFQCALSANHLRHAATNAEYWSRTLPQAKQYAQRLFRLPGAYFPWVPALFEWQDYHLTGVPNKFYYAHHNQASVVRMLHDYGQFTGDEDFTRTLGYPVIREIALIYRALLTVDLKASQFEIRYNPSQSQDEYAPPHQTNYFDALVAAEYTLQIASEMAQSLRLDEALRKEWMQVLAMGLAYSKLAHGDHYLVFEGDSRGDKSQRALVQINPVVFHPISEMYTAPRVLNSYRRRYQLCAIQEGKKSESFTLGSFLLASCRLRDKDGFLEDLGCLCSCGILDEDLIQAFEQTGATTYYLTTQYFIMESITECFLQSWNGVLEFFPMISDKYIEASTEEPIFFENLRVPVGFVVSGRICGDQEWARIHSEKGRTLILRIPERWPFAALYDNDGRFLALAKGNEVLSIDTRQDATYALVRKEIAPTPCGVRTERLPRENSSS